MPQDLNSERRNDAIETERLRFALSAAGVGTWDLDPIRNVVVWDERCRELFGFAPDEYVSYEQVLKYMHPEDMPVVHVAVQKALDPTTEGHYEVRYRTIGATDQKIRWVLSKGKAYFDEAGRAYRFAGTAQDITELVEEQEKVQITGKVAQLALENSGSGYFHVSQLNDKIEYSPGFAYILTGDAGAVLTQKDFEGFIHPADRLIRAKAHAVALRTRKLDYEARIIWKDGSIHWMRANGAYLTDTSGKPFLLTGTVYDISAEKKAREELETSEQRFRSLIEEAPVATCLFVDRELRIEVANEIMLRFWGKDASVIGMPLAQALPELAGQPFLQILDEVFTTGIAYESKAMPALMNTGGVYGTYYFDFTYKPLFDAEGKVYAIIDMATDVTQQVLARKRIEESEIKLRSVIAAAPAGIGLFIGRDLIIENPNQTFIDIVGKGWDIVGKPLREAMPELVTENQPFLQILDDVYTSGEMFHSPGSLVKIVQHGVMTSNYYNITYTPLLDGEGKVYAILDIAIDVTEQIKAQKKLEESELFSRSIIDNSPVAKVVLTGEDMMMERVNQNMLRMLGRDESIIGKPFMEVVPELLHTPLSERLRHVYQTGETYHQPEEKIELVRFGEPYTGYYNYIYKALRNTAGFIYGIIVTANEVTGQVKARALLEASENRLKSLVDSAPFPIGVYTGKEMKITLVNQSIMDVWGKGDDLVGKLYAEVLPELSGTGIYEQLDRVFTTGEPFHARNQQVDLKIEGRMKTFYFNYSFTPLFNADGSVYGVMNTAADVTDLNFAKQQVEEAEAIMRGAVELAELATWSMDIKGGVFSYSERFMEWLGFSEDTRNLDEAFNPVPETYRQEVMDAINKVIAPGSDGRYENEHPIINRVTGQERIIHAQGQVFYDAEGTAVILRGAAQDITEQRKLQLRLESQVQERTLELAAANEELQAVNEELTATNEELSEANNQLLHSNDELKQYAYVASHDLQEPLRKIQMFSGMLQNSGTLQQNDKFLLNKISKASERMTLLIRDLLDFSRLLKADSLMQPVDLAVIIQAVVDDFELAIEEKNAVVHIGPLPVIEAVALQINQLFYNLMGNALKFINRGVAPRIEVSSRLVPEAEVKQYIPKPVPYANYHHITFTDNGIGFEAKYAEQIFEVFKRLHGRDLYPGSGIGLALCRRIVANHGGHLFATSEAGKGTTFHVILYGGRHIAG